MDVMVDHVVVCLPDLDDSVTAFEREHGVASVPGGRHAGHGTANRLVPLGATYIELVTVVDDTEATQSVFGSWVRENGGSAEADGLALRTDDLDAISSRLGLQQAPMSRRRADGSSLHWRIAGLDDMVRRGLPFFIQWDGDPEMHPGRVPVAHPRDDVMLGQVEVAGDVELLSNWMGVVPGVTIRPGEPAVSFTLAR